MGKPAARITDITAHGGTIVGPGIPNVLVGKMPAAVMGDNHLCPMVTPVVPPVPHAGGPITLGSMGVLIGKRPAARMGDMCICVGPPATALMGCFTVLIGETGSGSGGGAGAAASASSAKVKKPKQAKPFPPYKPAKDKSENHAVSFQFKDSAGKPISGVPFTWKDPDGKEHACVSDAEGRFHKSGLQKKGGFDITVRRMARPKWSKKKAKLGDTINLQCSAREYTGQEPVTAALMQSINGTPYYVKPLEVKNNGSNIQAVFPANLTEAEINGAPAPESGPVDRKFHVLLQDENNVMLSEPLDLRQDIEQTLNAGGAPADNTRVEMRLGDGSFAESETEAEGKVVIQDAPLGGHKITSVKPAGETEDPAGAGTYLYTEDNLKRGDRDEKGQREGRPANITGTQVYDLQADLNSMGYDVGPPIGIYGPKTKTAVKEFQKDAGTKYRKKGEETQELDESTYQGQVTGVTSDAEKEEIKIWKEKGYVKPDIPRTRIEDSVGQGGKNDKPDVICVQKKLMELGYEVDSANGNCDEKMIKAIKMFQISFKNVKKYVTNHCRVSFPDGLISKGGVTDKTLFGSQPKKYVKPEKSKIKKINSDVEKQIKSATGEAKTYWNSIKAKWDAISPYLPADSYMTSGYRRTADQRAILHRWFNTKYKDQIIKKHGKATWKKYKDMQGKNDSVADPKMCMMIKEATGQLIAVPGRSAHQKGKAIDIGGKADIKQIQALLWYHVENDDITKILPERNGCLHFEF